MCVDNDQMTILHVRKPIRGRSSAGEEDAAERLRNYWGNEAIKIEGTRPIRCLVSCVTPLNTPIGRSSKGVAETILAHTAEDCDVLVVGAPAVLPGMDAKEFAPGKTAQELLRRSEVNVMLVRGQ